MEKELQQNTKGWRIPARYTPIAFAFFMSAIMAFLMCLVIVAANSGVAGAYGLRVLHAYQMAMPVAFICVLMVRPVVMKLVSWTVEQNTQAR